MPERKDPNEDLRPELERTRAELARLREEVEREHREESNRTSYYINTLENLLVSLGVCRLTTTQDLKVLHEKNTPQVFGLVQKGTPIAEIFGTDKARRYFETVQSMRDLFAKLPKTVEHDRWNLVFSSEGGKGGRLEDWRSVPAGAWQVQGGRAQVMVESTEREYYLLSPGELIGPEDDFRIEYTARADAAPRDLTVVVGAAPQTDDLGLYTRRPEADGYAFAFGAMGNVSTELQRQLVSIHSNRELLIQPGKEHRCVAERIGGLVRFTVDGKTAFVLCDSMPLMGAGRGHVSFYTCSINHVFSDVRVLTRPTCIPPDVRCRIAEMDGMILEVPPDRGPARFVRVHCTRPDRFLFSDVTDVIEERRDAESHERALLERLARADKMESLAQMAGGVAHDLNNILGPIVGFPTLVTEQLDRITESNFVKVAQDIKQDIAAIEWSARRAATVVQDLLTLSRRGHYQKKSLSLNSVIKALLGSRETLALHKAKPSVLIEPVLDASIPPLLGSDIHLTRVIGNLVRNSFEAMGERGTLRITTALRLFPETTMGHEVMPAGEYLFMTVSDTGSGIDAKDLARVFEPFFSTKKRTPHSGTGLGLSVVHGIVKDHGGFIDVKSRKGKGTTFEICFPVTKTAVEQTAAPMDTRSLKGGTEHVLVVDDSEAQLHVMHKFLRRLGYTCTTVQSGREALKLFRQTQEKGLPNVFDLILLDMVMEEDFDGLTTYQKVLELYPRQKTIIVSGYSPTGRAQEAVKLGAGWLSKPFTIQELAEAVRQRLDN